MSSFLGFFKRKKVVNLSDQTIFELGFKGEVVSILKQVSDNQLYELKITEPIYNDTPDETGVYFTCSEEEAERIVLDLQCQLQHSGYLAFIAEKDYGQGEKTKIAVIRGTDQFDILKTMQTNGENYDISNEEVSSKLMQWHKLHPFTIMGANVDWFEAKFMELPSDDELMALAEETYDFCPDVVDQGTETIQELFREMKESQKIFLWWD